MSVRGPSLIIVRRTPGSSRKPIDWPKAKSLVDRVCKTLSRDPNGRDIADYGNRLDKLADSLTNEHQDIARSLRDSASKIRNSDHRTNLTGK